MINELHDLASALRGISDYKITPQHNLYNACPAKGCYRIWLHDNGDVADIEAIDDSLREMLRRYGQKLTTFPAFKIAALYRVSNTEDVAYFRSLLDCKAEIRLEYLRQICKEDNWPKSLYDKITRCLNLALPITIQNKCIDKLMQITQGMTANRFRESLERFIWSALETEQNQRLLLSVLLGVDNPSTSDWSGSIFLDISSYNIYDQGYPISSKFITDEINLRLLEYEHEKERNNGEKSLDAFGSTCDLNEFSVLMPAVNNVPVLGEIKLRSLNKDIPCQARYGKVGSLTFPIGSKNRDSYKDALRYLSRKSQEGITWQKATDALFYVYPDKQPKVPLHLASLFGIGQIENNHTIARFEDIAKTLADTLVGISSDKKPRDVRIFSIRKADKARRKVELSINLSPDDLIRAAEDWQRGFSNIPSIYFAETVTLYPLEVYKVANQVWKIDGETKKSVPQMRYFQGVEMLLNITQPSEFLYHLSGLLANCAGLVIFTGNELPKGRHGKLNATHKAAIGKLLPLMGMLLYKLKCDKEDYMESSAFLLGQILKISDGLHALYCKEKRKGEIPPQLVGNALFVTASENPEQALALLGTRMCPYIAWAKQSENKLAWWFLGRYEEVMTRIMPQITAGMRYSDIDKAQLFMGYLAKLPGEKSEAVQHGEPMKNTEEETNNE